MEEAEGKCTHCTSAVLLRRPSQDTGWQPCWMLPEARKAWQQVGSKRLLAQHSAHSREPPSCRTATPSETSSQSDVVYGTLRLV